MHIVSTNEKEKSLLVGFVVSPNGRRTQNFIIYHMGRCLSDSFMIRTELIIKTMIQDILCRFCTLFQ